MLFALFQGLGDKLEDMNFLRAVEV